MRVLVACEESQEVCKAFRALGHEAYSCDIQECSGGHPEWHIQGDVLPLLNEKWDLIIAHPPCTYLSNAGARWLYAGGKLNQDRYKKGLEGKEFFLKFLNANCGLVAIENPIPSSVYDLPQYTQVIQPYEFGEPWSKKTCLWLKGLPPLQPTEIISDHKPFCSSGSYSKNHDPKYKGASRKGGSAKSRSKTFPGIARAMAEQWGGIEPPKGGGVMAEIIETNIFDQEEIHPNCTVQILRNSITGEVSVGWWPNDNKPIKTKEGN